VSANPPCTSGYGNFFVPRIGATARVYKGFVPDFDIFVRF
jgi:hypothetical protein